MAVAALKKITLEVEKVTKNLEKKNRKEGRTRPVMRTWMPKPSPTLLIGLKKCVEATVAFVGKEDNFCPKVKKQEKGARHLEDQSDEVHRKSFVGLFSSPARLTTIWRA